MTQELGKLVHLNPRDVWSNEAADFTPWLKEHIDQLSAAVGVDIQLVEREVAAGAFSVDLVGEEPGSRRAVIIENQLEKTNHDHLGKLLTYAAGKDGGVIIWISPEIRPEHRNALEWMNNATRGNIDFFGVELELLQIDASPKVQDSPKAPNFKVVVAPKYPESAGGQPLNGQHTERGQRYQRFFERVLSRIRSTRSGIINASKVGSQSWLATPSGRSGFAFSLAFALRTKFRIELYIDTGDTENNKAAFDAIHEHEQSVEDQLGMALSWERLDRRRASRIAWYWDEPVTVMDDAEKLQKVEDWAIDNYFKFRDTLAPYLDMV